MNLHEEERGFIFSFDATLAVLVAMIALAGVASANSSSTIYRQHGGLRLERYAEDALNVMDISGALDDTIESVVVDNLSHARKNARRNLQSILPSGIQFKFLIGDEEITYLDNVYPGTDNQAWEVRLENAEERKVATRITAKRVTPLKVLVWVDTRLPSDQVNMIDNFAERIDKPSWDVRTTSDEAEFSDYLWGFKDWVPNAVFIPDSKDFQNSTIDGLIHYFNIVSGGVVGGGGFLYNNDYDFPFFGLWSFSDMYRDTGHNNFHITKHVHPLTATSPNYVDYKGNEYPVYEYLFLHPSTKEKATPLVDNLAYWPGTGGYWHGPYYINQDWVAMTARESGKIEENQYNRTVLFNAHLAQSAEEGVGTEEWVELAQRSLEWVSFKEFKEVKLYVWRGEGIS